MIDSAAYAGSWAPMSRLAPTANAAPKEAARRSIWGHLQAAHGACSRIGIVPNRFTLNQPHLGRRFYMGSYPGALAKQSGIPTHNMRVSVRSKFGKHCELTR